jgi:hypothetical protein
MSYILIVVTVVLNVVLAVLLDEFLKAQDHQKHEQKEQRGKSSEGTHHFCGALDPFLKYLSEFYNSDEMPMRIEEAFNLLDYNNTGFVNFLKVKVGLERLKFYPKVKLLEEDWRDITNDGKLCGDDDTLTSHQFFEVIRNQVTLYVQRMASKTLFLEQGHNGKEVEMNNTFVLKYLVAAIDDLRSNVKSMHNSPYSSSEYHGQDKFLGRASQKRKKGLRRECASSQWPIMTEVQDGRTMLQPPSPTSLTQSAIRQYPPTAEAAGGEPPTMLYPSKNQMRDDVEYCSAKADGSQAGITISFAPEMVHEQSDASSVFVDQSYTIHAGDMHQTNSLTGYSLIANGELASLRQATVDVQHESEQLRRKLCLSDSLLKAFCQDFPDKLIKRINTMVMELTAEYLNVADDSDGRGLKNGQSQHGTHPMNSTKAVPDIGSKGSLMPSPYENPNPTQRSNNPCQAATAASLHPAPQSLRQPVLMVSATDEPIAPHVASTDCQQHVDFLRHSTLLCQSVAPRPPERDPPPRHTLTSSTPNPVISLTSPPSHRVSTPCPLRRALTGKRLVTHAQLMLPIYPGVDSESGVCGI